MDTAEEDMSVICARMAAPVAERRVLAVRANFERATRSGQLVTAVSAQAKHATCYRQAQHGPEPAASGVLATSERDHG
jgi:hypothetical protein